jgi:hypothetical protein
MAVLLLCSLHTLTSPRLHYNTKQHKSKFYTLMTGHLLPPSKDFKNRKQPRTCGPSSKTSLDAIDDCPLTRLLLTR